MSEEKEILDILEATGAYLKDGHFKLVSGNHSDSYIHIRLALAYPEYLSILAKKLADQFQRDRINAIFAFTIAGIKLAESVAKFLDARLIIAEKKENKIILAKDYTIEKDENVLIVEDVLTTGKSICQAIDTIRGGAMGILKGVGVVVDRSEREQNFGVKTVRLLKIPMNLWSPDSCPKCKQNLPLTDLSSPNGNLYAVLYSLPEKIRPVLNSTYHNILEKLEKGRVLEEVLAFYKPINELPGKKYERVAVLGSFNDFSSMDNIARYIASLGYYGITSKLVYEKDTAGRKELKPYNYESMNDFLKRIIFSCQYVIIVYSMPGSGGQFIETTWCSESNKSTLGLVHFPPWVIYDPKACDNLIYDNTKRIFFCNGFSAYKLGAQVIGGWICQKRKNCPFPTSNLTKMILDLYITSQTMFLVGGEPKNFKDPVHAFLRNKGVIDLKTMS